MTGVLSRKRYLDVRESKHISRTPTAGTDRSSVFKLGEKCLVFFMPVSVSCYTYLMMWYSDVNVKTLLSYSLSFVITASAVIALGMLISFFFQKSIFVLKKSIFFRLSNLVLCVAHSRPTDAAVTLCARPYIAAARKRTTGVRNAIRGIGSADRMRSL